MIRPLIIGLEEQAKIKELKAKALKHPVTIERLRKLNVNNPNSVLTLKDYTPEQRAEENLAQDKLILPMGYRVAYSVEHQPFGLCGHLSVSVDAKGMTPNIQAMFMIAQAFELEAFEIWVEEFEPGWHAINLLGLLGTPHAGKA